MANTGKDGVSAEETLVAILNRIKELEDQQARQQSEQAQMQTEQAQMQVQIQQQAEKIHALQKKNLVLQAKIDGRENGFYLFSLLPPELRYMVWKWALASGRVVELASKCGRYYRRAHYTLGYDRRPDLPYGYGFDTVTFHHLYEKSQKIENLLSTCKESRKCILNVLEASYDTCFTYKPDPNYTYFADHQCGDLFDFKDKDKLEDPITLTEIMKNASGRVRFRPETDIVYFSEKNVDFVVIEDCEENGLDFDSVRILAMDDCLIDRFWSSIHFANHRGLSFLDQLILVETETSKISYPQSGIFFGEWYANNEELKAAVEKAFKEQVHFDKDSTKPEIILMREEELRALM